ncbi:MAG: winged helix-turn-helix transcriptional regulator [Oscillospiraceae bacterium]|nr:winged helix-turn-helix transcriptional regulator [Oscillospiraceae bacterium]
MGYEIIREPFMLLETVWMLYRFVNKISFQQDLSEHRYVTRTPIHEAAARRMFRLQEIADEVCAELDPEDPVLRRFFSNQEVDTEDRVDTCLAALMTFPLTAMGEPEFHKNAEEIRATWKRLQAEGAWIHPESGNLLQFSTEPEDHGDLFRQIRALNLPAEFRMELYDALRNFDQVFDELLALIEPLARRLEKCYRRDAWLLAEPLEYWQAAFAELPPAEFLIHFLTLDEDLSAMLREGDWVVGLSLMLGKNLVWHSKAGSPISPEKNYAYIGCAIDTSKQRGRREERLEQISAILKILGDKKRLEVLQRLSRESSYCYELAERMQVDYGNLSRTLATLHGYGFLRQKRGPSRTYYETDLDAIHEFLQVVESIISK